MTAQHTSVPWESKRSYDGLRIVHYLGMGSDQVICSIDPAMSPAQREANARLIVAAPELLTACQWMRDFIEAVNEDRVSQDQRELYEPMMQAAASAIAKAGATWLN